MNMTQTDPAGSRAWLRRAGHAGGAYDADIAECRNVVSAGIGLHYVAHITSGIFDFALECAGLWQPGQDMAEALDRAGRQLSLAVAQLDSACEPLDSGALIRVVIQGENGALFQALKVAGQTFFGLTLNGAPENVDQADRQLAHLAESAARRVGAASLLWGGFRTTEASSDLWRHYEGEARPPAPLPGTGCTIAGSERSPSGPVTDACRSALHEESLHYIGIFRHGQPLWCADIFDHARLEPFFQRITPSARRHGYERLARQIELQIRRFRQLLALVRSDHLVRLVLDVARGAIFILPLTDDESLVGVTLIQSQVEHADRRMNALRETLATMGRGTGQAPGNHPPGE